MTVSGIQLGSGLRTVCGGGGPPCIGSGAGRPDASSSESTLKCARCGGGDALLGLERREYGEVTREICSDEPARPRELSAALSTSARRKKWRAASGTLLERSSCANMKLYRQLRNRKLPRILSVPPAGAEAMLRTLMVLNALQNNLELKYQLKN